MLSGKIHNYFFAKGLGKLAEGGLMACITTDAFLNSPSNKTARKYLFDKADFISLAVMPDNLMKDTGNTEAPNHLLIVQKNTAKQYHSDEEEALIANVQMKNIYGRYSINQYIHDNPEIIAGNEIKPGKNQYGQADETVLQQGDINAIAGKLKEILNEDVANRLNHALYEQAKAVQVAEAKTAKEKLTYLAMPENKSENVSVQLGLLFDTAPAENINRAMAYLNPLDETVVQKETARIISTIRTTDNPTHENIVLLTAKQHKSNRYLYKLYSNVKEVNHLSANWMGASLLAHELTGISNHIKQFDHAFKYESDQTLEGLFNFQQNSLTSFGALNPSIKKVRW